jgi:hypothetical protein
LLASPAVNVTVPVRDCRTAFAVAVKVASMPVSPDDGVTVSHVESDTARQDDGLDVTSMVRDAAL